MGQVLVLLYHLIGDADSVYSRTPQDFRQDLAGLRDAGYYPINVTELVEGAFDIPAGKSPVVITFDDSSGGQYRIGPYGEIDPECAVAIMLQMATQAGWNNRATFFPLIDVDYADHELFGQPALKEQKLRQLVSWGYEVGSHTVTHLDLKKASANQAKKQLCESQKDLEKMIGGGYHVTSVAVPFGSFPSDVSLLAGGEYQGTAYTYRAALAASGGPCPSPFSDQFDPYHIPRTPVSGTSLADALGFFEKHPELRYVSDGDPSTICVPGTLAAALGALDQGRAKTVVRY